MKELLQTLKAFGFEIEDFSEGYNILYDSYLVATIDEKTYKYSLYKNVNGLRALLDEYIEEED